MSRRAAPKRRAEVEAPARSPCRTKVAKKAAPEAETGAQLLPQLPPVLRPFGEWPASQPDTLTINIYENKDWVDVPDHMMVQLGREQELPSKLDIDYNYHVRVAAIRVPPFVIHALQPLTSLTRIEFSGGHSASTTADPFDKLPLGSPSCSLPSLKVARFSSTPLTIAVASLATFAPNLEQLSCHSLTVEAGRDICGYGACLPRLTHLSAHRVHVQHVHSAEEAGRAFVAAVPALRVLPQIPSVIGNRGYFVYDHHFVPFCRPDFYAYDFMRYCSALVALHRGGSIWCGGIWDPAYAAWAAPIVAAAAKIATPQHQAALAAADAEAAAGGRHMPPMMYDVPNLGLVCLEHLEAAATRVPPAGLPVLRGLPHLRCLKLSGLTELDLPFVQEVSQLRQLRGFECSVASSSVAGQMEGLLEALGHLPQLLAVGLPGELLCWGGCLKPGTGRAVVRVQQLLLELAGKPCMRKMVFTEPRGAEDARYAGPDVAYCSHDCWKKGLADLKSAVAAAAAAGAGARPAAGAGTPAARGGGAGAPPAAAPGKAEKHKKPDQHEKQQQQEGEEEEEEGREELQERDTSRAAHDIEAHAHGPGVDIVLLHRGSNVRVGSGASDRKPHPVWGEFETAA